MLKLKTMLASKYNLFDYCLPHLTSASMSESMAAAEGAAEALHRSESNQSQDSIGPELLNSGETSTLRIEDIHPMSLHTEQANSAPSNSSRKQIATQSGDSRNTSVPILVHSNALNHQANNLESNVNHLSTSQASQFSRQCSGQSSLADEALTVCNLAEARVASASKEQLIKMEAENSSHPATVIASSSASAGATQALEIPGSGEVVQVPVQILDMLPAISGASNVSIGSLTSMLANRTNADSTSVQQQLLSLLQTLQQQQQNPSDGEVMSQLPTAQQSPKEGGTSEAVMEAAEQASLQLNALTAAGQGSLLDQQQSPEARELLGNSSYKLSKASLEAMKDEGGSVAKCLVCGDRSSGVHYGVLACEGCKGFFRRALNDVGDIKNKKCYYGKNCEISVQTRNRCQYCRLQKCLALGMSRAAAKLGRRSRRMKEVISEVVRNVDESYNSPAVQGLLCLKDSSYEGGATPSATPGEEVPHMAKFLSPTSESMHPVIIEDEKELKRRLASAAQGTIVRRNSSGLPAPTVGSSSAQVANRAIAASRSQDSKLLLKVAPAAAGSVPIALPTPHLQPAPAGGNPQTLTANMSEAVLSGTRSPLKKRPYQPSGGGPAGDAEVLEIDAKRLLSLDSNSAISSYQVIQRSGDTITLPVVVSSTLPSNIHHLKLEPAGSAPPALAAAGPGIPMGGRGSTQELNKDVAARAQLPSLQSHDYTEKVTKAFLEGFPTYTDWLHGKFLGDNKVTSSMLSEQQKDELLFEQGFSGRLNDVIMQVVKFAKQVPGFSMLDTEDQMALVKGACFEVAAVAHSPTYDSATDSMFVVGNRVWFYRSDMKAHLPLGAHFVNLLYNFCQRFNLFQLSLQETALFVTLLLVSPDRYGLKNCQQIITLQEQYINALSAEVQKQHPTEPGVFAKLLMIISNLREVSVEHRRSIREFMITKRLQVDDLHAEIFDLQDTELH